VNTICLAEKNS